MGQDKKKYKGVLCREPLSGLEVTPKNIKYAERLLGVIKNKISLDQLNYTNYFPSSKRKTFLGVTSKQKTIKDYLDEYITICETRGLSPSSVGGYKKCSSALKELHQLPAVELTPAILKKWITSRTTALKTIRNQLSFLRSAVDEAITDGLIQFNPANSIKASRYKAVKNTEDEASYIVDPLSPEEVNAILNVSANAQIANLFNFALQTGMRSSELCALRWDHIDFIGKTAHVVSAKVSGVTKGTKTVAGKRKIELPCEAMAVLASQKALTFMRGETVFEDPKLGVAWAGADAIRKKAWVPTLKKAGVRYRNPYQTRHTFATRHISKGVNLFWLARQMGHKGPEMIFRHYGSYLKEYDGQTSIKEIKM